MKIYSETIEEVGPLSGSCTRCSTEDERTRLACSRMGSEMMKLTTEASYLTRWVDELEAI